MPPAIVHDYEALMSAARAYVHSKGYGGPAAEDLIQTMLLGALERPEQPFSLHIAYLRALDQLDPRHRQQGQNTRDSTRAVSLEPQYTEQGSGPRAPGDGTAALAAVPDTGSVRAVMLLYGSYGYTMAEIGILFGVTVSRISQVLSGAGLANPQPPVEPFFCEACHSRPRWKAGGYVRYCALCRVARIRASRRRTAKARAQERSQQRDSLEDTP